MPATKQILGCMFTVKRSSVCDVHLFINSQAKLKCGQLAALQGGAEVCLCPLDLKVTCLSQDIYHHLQVLNYLSNNCSEFQPQILFSSHHINFYNSCHFDFYLDKTCPVQGYSKFPCRPSEKRPRQLLYYGNWTHFYIYLTL